MSTMNLFELATRKKFRFESKAGLLSVEDLWDLPLDSRTKASLNEVAINISRELKAQTESFVAIAKKDTTNEQKLEIVKYVIDVRLEEAKAIAEAQDRAAQRAKIDELIAKKKDESLEGLSLEELLAMREQV